MEPSCPFAEFPGKEGVFGEPPCEVSNVAQVITEELFLPEDAL